MIDSVTGVLLLVIADGIEAEVEPGKALTLDVDVDVVAAEVRLLMEGDCPQRIDHLRIDTDKTGLRHLKEFLPLGGGTYGCQGVYVEGRSGPVRFFVPPGRVRLSVGGASGIDGGAVNFGGHAGRAELEVDAVAGQPLTIELEAGPPLPLATDR